MSILQRPEGEPLSIKRTALSVDKNFTIVPNDWLRDGRLSLRARGLLAQLMSHSVGWEVTVESLVRVNPEGRDAIRRAVNELIDAGYLTREQERGERNKFGNMAYIITEPTPATEKPTAVEPTSEKAPTKKTIFTEDHLEEPSSSADEVFGRFWSVYPKKVSKQGARKVWDRKIKTTDPEAIIAGAKQYAAWLKAEGKSKQYYKDPDGWLNAGKWEDELEVTNKQPAFDPWSKEAYVA